MVNRTDWKYRLVGVVLSMLIVLGVLAMPSAQAVEGQASAGLVSVTAQVEYQAVPIPDTVETLSGAAGSYGEVSSQVDARGHWFVAYGNLNPANSNQTWVEIHEYSPPGALVNYWIVYPEAEFKVDSVDITYSCPDLKTDMTTHSYLGARRRQLETAVIRGVFNCGTGGSQASMIRKAGGPNAYQPVGGSGGGSIGPTLDEIRAVVREEIQAAQATIISNMIPKTKAALQQEGVLTLGNVYTSHGLYKRFEETTYQQVLKGLAEYPVAKATPTPTPFIRLP